MRGRWPLPDRLVLGGWLATFGVIAWASLSPSDAQQASSGHASWFTNMGHVPAYALLTSLTLWYTQQRCRTRLRTAALSAALALAIGVGFEALQPLVGRDGDLADFTLNALGVGLALIVWSHGWRPRLHPRSS